MNTINYENDDYSRTGRQDALASQSAADALHAPQVQALRTGRVGSGLMLP